MTVVDGVRALRGNGPVPMPVPTRTPARTLARNARVTSRRRRGAQMLEFAIVLPIVLFMLTFMLDMGRMVLISGVLQDATQVAARSGAQVGGAGSPTTGPAREALDQSLDDYPGVEAETTHSFVIESGERCRTTGTNRHVAIQVNYPVDFITPGLTMFLNMMDGEDRAPEGAWLLRATAVSRCEIVLP